MKNKISKVIFITAISFLLVWILAFFMRMILSLEFTTAYYEFNYNKIFLIGAPVSILLSLFGTLKTSDKKTAITEKIIGTSILSLVVAFFYSFIVFFNMCGWSNEKVLFENKTDVKIKIIVREHGCGATDSEPSKLCFFKVTRFSKYFKRWVEIDTSKIDSDQWIKLENGYFQTNNK